MGPIVEREEDGFRAALRADVMKACHTVLYYEHAIRLDQDALRIEQEIERIVERRGHRRRGRRKSTGSSPGSKC